MVQLFQDSESHGRLPLTTGPPTSHYVRKQRTPPTTQPVSKSLGHLPRRSLPALFPCSFRFRRDPDRLSRTRGFSTGVQPYQPRGGQQSERSSVLKCHCAVVMEISKDVADSTLMDSCVCGCSGGACIPQREYQRQRTHPVSQHDLQEMILFSVNGKCGYPLVDALRKQYRGLDGRDDKMFVDFKSSISLRLEVSPPTPARSNGRLDSRLQWLPYKKWTRQVGADSRISLHER